MRLTTEQVLWGITVLIELAVILCYWIGRHEPVAAEPDPEPPPYTPYIPPPWPAVQDDGEKAMRAALELDLQEFERVAWPVFERRGYSKNTAVVIWWLRDVGQNVVTMQVMLESSFDGPDDKKEPWQQ